MAFSFIKTTSATTGVGTTILSISGPTTQYSLVVLHIRITSGASNGITVTSIEDDAGNVYVIGSAYDDAAASNRFYQAYGIQSSGLTSLQEIVVNFSGSAGNKTIYYDEFSGFGQTANNSNIFRQVQSKNGTGTDLAVDSFATSSGNLITVTSIVTLTRIFTAGTNYTLAGPTGVLSNPQAIASQYRLSSGTSETAPWSISSSTTWVEVVREFGPPPPSIKGISTITGISSITF